MSYLSWSAIVPIIAIAVRLYSRTESIIGNKREGTALAIPSALFVHVSLLLELSVGPVGSSGPAACAISVTRSLSSELATGPEASCASGGRTQRRQQDQRRTHGLGRHTDRGQLGMSLLSRRRQEHCIDHVNHTI